MHRNMNLWMKLLPKIELQPEVLGMTGEDIFALAFLQPAGWPIELTRVHWVWKGAKTKNNPLIKLHRDIIPVRRIMYCLMNDDPEPKSNVYQVADCNCEGCINPLHTATRRYRDVKLQEKFIPKGSLSDTEALQELIDEIFGSCEPRNVRELVSNPKLSDFSQQEILTAMSELGLELPNED